MFFSINYVLNIEIVTLKMSSYHWCIRALNYVGEESASLVHNLFVNGDIRIGPYA